MTGFLEESPGVRSMTRLTVILLVACIFVLTGSIPVVAILRAEQAAGIIAAIAGVITGLAGGVWGALRERA